ncbi:MAG TPA: CinA family nicotinamide mononucleotide deamidase-related protein [Planctomycetaceae bacterium]|nr:CinA family nicotinamide mononucleotide deamidase-related protein [Planctomycetaceae bacterium]
MIKSRQRDAMQAEIIAVGTELTSGAKLDTNSQWLSTELAARGIHVEYHTAVADTLESIVSVIRHAIRRVQFVIITGGLGPTLDDITRQALAEILHVSLIEDPEYLEIIRKMFERRGREMPERNRIQAKFPAGTEPLPNPIGTAPGILCEIPRLSASNQCVVAALPGVPAEMKKMFLEQLLPRFPFGKTFIRRARVNCFGVGESDAEEKLGDLTARGCNPEIGITVHEATITLRINATGTSHEECESLIGKAKQEIRDCLGTLVFGEEDEELEHVVLRYLAFRNETLATVERGTGGLLSHRLTEVDEHREWYLGGVVIPGGTTSWNLLQYDPDWLGERDPVSKEIALEMARRCREMTGADHVLSVTECPQELAGSEQSPIAYVALVGKLGEVAVPHRLLGDQSFQKSRAAKAALNLLRLEILKKQEN